METMDTILSRKSVRSYTGEKPSAEELQTVLQAANASPAGMGKYETLHLSVIEDQVLLQKINESAAKTFGRPDVQLFYGAPVFVLVSAKPDEKGLGNLEYSNAAIMVHNMALAAVELGLGSCYIWGGAMALSANPALVGQLNLPDGFLPCCGIVLGKTQEQYAKRDIPADRVAKDYI